MTPEQIDTLDRATSDRLHRLASMPVDTSRLDRRLKAALEPADTAAPVAWWRRRPAASIAAVLAVAAAIAVMTVTGPRAAAAPLDFGRVHAQVTDGRLPATDAADLAAAKRIVASLVRGEPRAQGDYPRSVRCCCGQLLDGERIAFIRSHAGQTPVTIMLMRGYHACAGQDHEVVDDQGRRFTVHHDHTGVQATLTPRNDHWICVLADLPTAKQIDVAGQLVF